MMHPRYKANVNPHQHSPRLPRLLSNVTHRPILTTLIRRTLTLFISFRNPRKKRRSLTSTRRNWQQQLQHSSPSTRRRLTPRQSDPTSPKLLFKSEKPRTPRQTPMSSDMSHLLLPHQLLPDVPQSTSVSVFSPNVDTLPIPSLVLIHHTSPSTRRVSRSPLQLPSMAPFPPPKQSPSRPARAGTLKSMKTPRTTRWPT